MFVKIQGFPISSSDSLLLDYYLNSDYEKYHWSTSNNTKIAHLYPGGERYELSKFDAAPVSLLLAKKTTTYLDGFSSNRKILNPYGRFNVVVLTINGLRLYSFNHKLRFNGSGNSLVSTTTDTSFNASYYSIDIESNSITSEATRLNNTFINFTEIVDCNYDIPSYDMSSIAFRKSDVDPVLKYTYPGVSVLPFEDFEKNWGLREDLELPRVLKRGNPQPGIPGESIKHVIFVDKHDDGTMFYNGEIYRSMKMSQPISKFVGEPGEEVTQVWEGEKQKALDGRTYVFLASGVQDPDFPGGYGGYTDEQSRTVTLRSDRSIDVNFYYTAMELPPYNYLMRVAVPDGIAHIAIMKTDVSSIKVKMHDGSICTVDIVLPDDEQASPIRVMLPTGIYALKKIEIPAK